MVNWTIFITYLTIISGWEIGKRALKMLHAHRHKWINLGKDPEQWVVHFGSTTKGGYREKMLPLLELYTHGFFCLKCTSYQFEQIDAKGKVKQTLNFHQIEVRGGSNK